MPKLDPATRRRQITRLSIVAAVAFVLCGGLVALYNLNRPKPIIVSDEQIIDQARQAYTEEDYEQVITLLENSAGNATIPAIQDDAELLDIYITARQSTPLYNNGHLSRIVTPLTRLVELSPDDVSHAQALVETLLTLNRNDDALTQAQALLQQYPDDVRLIQHLAETQERKGQFEDATATLNQSIQFAPLEVRTHARLLKLINAYDQPLEPFLEQAEAIYLAHQDDPRAMMIRALSHETEGDLVQARELLKQASATAPPDAAITTLLTQWLDRLGLHDHATRYIMQHAEPGIETPAGRMAIYRAFEQNNSQTIITRLEGSKPTKANSDLLGIWVHAHLQTKSLDQAQPLLAELRERNNAIAATWVKLLEIDQRDAPQPGQTIDTIMALIESDNRPIAQTLAARHPYFMQRLGDAYRQALEPEAAYSAFAIAATNSTSWARPHHSLADVLLELGQPRAALPHAKEAFARSGSATTRQSLVLAMAGITDLRDTTAVDRVLSEADKLPAHSSEAYRVLPTLVSMLANANRDEEAKQRATEALKTERTIPAEPLESLLRQSIIHELGLDNLVQKTIQTQHGMTPGLALIQATLLAQNGNPAQGRALIEKATPTPPTRPWQIALSDYLVSQNDPEAAADLLKIADQYPDDLERQQAALSARGLNAEDSARLIARLKDTAGQATVRWRLARARMTTASDPSEPALREIVALLEEALPYAPIHLELRLVLSRCYLLLNEDDAAADRAQAAKTIAPNNIEARFLNGMALHRLKRNQEARLDLIPLALTPAVPPSTRWQACLMLNEQGEYEVVQRAVEQMWAAGQANNQVLTLLARIYRSAGQLSQADAVCEAILGIPEIETVRFLANHYHQTNRPELAAKAIEAARAAGITEADHLALLAEDAAQEGQYPIALRLIEDAAKVEPNRAKRWRDASRLAISLAKPDDALRLASQGLQQLADEPGLAAIIQHAVLIQQIEADPSLIPMAVTILSQNNEHEQAVQALRIIRDTESNTDAANALADLAKAHPQIKYLSELAADRLLQAGLNDQAYALATEAMARFPDSAATARVASIASFRLQEWVILLSSATAWGERNPRDRMNADLMRAAAMNQLDRFPAVIQTLGPYIQVQSEITSSNQLLFEYYTRALSRNGQIEQAQAVLAPQLQTSAAARAVALKRVGEDLVSAQLADTWLNDILRNSDTVQEKLAVATTSFLAGQRLNNNAMIQQADAIITGLLQTDAPAPLRLEMQYAKGQIAQRLGKLSQAEASYRAVMAAVPDNPLILNNLAVILMEGDEASLAEAEQLATKATQLASDDPNVFDTLAVIYLRRNRAADALRMIDQAIALDGANPTWRFTQADILEAMGQTERALLIRERYAPLQQDDSN